MQASFTVWALASPLYRAYSVHTASRQRELRCRAIHQQTFLPRRRRYPLLQTGTG